MAEASTRTADRTFELLAIVCESGPIGLAAAARAAGLPTSTSLRLLRSLETNGFVSRNAETQEFSPGPRLLQLGAAGLAQEHVVNAAARAMAELSEQTRESAYLSVVGFGGTALYVHIAEGWHSVRHVSWVGKTIPLDGSAAGAALTGATPYGQVAVNRGGIEDDVTALATPIGFEHRVLGALSLVVPSYRIDAERAEVLSSALVATAESVSLSLGRPAPSPSR